jgi:hypothetical protein
LLISEFSCSAAQADPGDMVNATLCATACSRDSCQPRDFTPAGLQQCRGRCEARCIAKWTHHTTILPHYQILTIVYAPPGCTSTPSAKCGSNSSVDYLSASSTGTKTTLSSSFKAGVNVSVSDSVPIVGDNGVAIGKFTGGVSDDFSSTYTDSVSDTITKSQSFDIKVQANGDGIDHEQDQFIVLLNPAIYLANFDEKITWGLGYAGKAPLIYVLYGKWLTNPQSMPTNVADELKARGFTDSDYKNILSQDPFVSEPADIDPARYILTKTFPYEPPLTASNCNNGVCNCISLTGSIKNDFQHEEVHTVQTQYSLGFSGGIELGGFGLKNSDTIRWTNTQSTTNTTGSSSSASATISCPSSTYAGPTLMAIYWDTIYGSFMFASIQTGPNTVLLQRGRVTTASGEPAIRRDVVLSVGGREFQTVTDQNGDYQIYDFSGGAGTGIVSVDGVRTKVPVGKTAHDAIQLK